MSAKYLLKAITHSVKGNLIKYGHMSRPLLQQGSSYTQKRSMADVPSKPWMLFGAVCLERLPLVGSTLSEFQQTHSQLLKTEEVEKSYLSDHELRYREDEKLLKTKKEEMKEETARRTTAELEDQWEIDFNSFQFPLNITEADKRNDTQSLQRKCDAKLILLAKQKLGSKEFWILPQGVHQQGESMRETAERVLRELCGEDVNGIFLGNAPCGVYKYKYPKDQENIGAKVFFFKAHHRTGNVSNKSKDLIDYSWLTKQEIAEKTPSEYFKAIDQFIIDL